MSMQMQNDFVMGEVGINSVVYKRIKSNERIELENEFTMRYNALRSFIFSSGTNALVMTIKTIIHQKGYEGIFLHGNKLFGNMINTVLPNLELEYPKIKFIGFDVTDTYEFDKLIDKYRNSIIGLYVESACNPEGHMFDWNLLKKYNRLFVSGQVSILVDNTWLSSVIFNPFDIGANVVVESCAKYNSIGKGIAGVVITNSKKTGNQLEGIITMYGIHVPENHCKLIYNNLLNLNENVNIITTKTYEIIQILNKTLIDVEINCIGMENHISYQLFKKYCNKDFHCAGVFTLCINNVLLNNEDNLNILCEKQEILLAKSFGRQEELINMTYASGTHNNKKYIVLRISIGLNTNQQRFAQKLYNLSYDLQNN
jgi:cystathionine beta-lyase/cystathionine gamma-synthase